MFVVMDTFNFPQRAPMLCTDDNGDTLVFDLYDEAEAFGKENCQSYQVVPVGEPEVHILIDGGLVDTVRANVKVSVRVYDFDEPSFMTKSDKAEFAQLRKEWAEVEENSIVVR